MNLKGPWLGEFSWKLCEFVRSLVFCTSAECQAAQKRVTSKLFVFFVRLFFLSKMRKTEKAVRSTGVCAIIHLRGKGKRVLCLSFCAVTKSCKLSHHAYFAVSHSLCQCLIFGNAARCFVETTLDDCIWNTSASFLNHSLWRHDAFTTKEASKEMSYHWDCSRSKKTGDEC